MKQLLFVVLTLLIFQNVKSQQLNQAFLSAYANTGAQEFFYKNSRASSGSYIYVTGASLNNDGHYDMLLTKYSGTTEIWSVTWNGSANGDDYASDVVIDGSGNIIVCGTSEVTSTNYNAVVVKYNSSGALQWASSYAGSAGLADGYASIAVDGSNNIYAVGGTQTATELSNFLTVKYNSNGTQQWASTYDYLDLNDLAVKVLIGGSSIRVSGGTQGNSTHWKMTTVSYNISSGAQGSVNSTGGDNEGIDQVKDACLDGVNSYVVGGVVNGTGYDWKIIKLDSNLTVLWSATFNGSDNLDDIANNVKVDGSGNVYVTGFTTETDEGKNFLTRKYNSSGTLQWSKSLHEELDDEANTMEINSSGDVIVSGSSYKNGNLDYLTLKYKSADGSELWRTRFNSDFNDDDIPTNIAIDENGGIFVIGTTGKGNGLTTYTLCKYSEVTFYLPSSSSSTTSSRGYTTNKGQLRNSDGTSNTAVKFYDCNGNMASYLENRYVNFQIAKGLVETDDDTTFRVKMDYTKGSTTTKVYPYSIKKQYNNYYFGHMAQPSERTEIAEYVIRPNSYTNTDIIFTHTSSGFRHCIVARTGAPTSDFEMTFTGQTGLSTDGNGNLIIGSTLGNITITKAKAYSMNNSTGALTLLGLEPTYSISGNIVSFSGIGSWSGTLVLEYGQPLLTSGSNSLQNVDWSTFFGGEGMKYDWYTDVVCTDSNEIYAVGSTDALSFQGQVGQTIYSPGFYYNSLLCKFNNECQNVYNLFYGGDGNDELSSISLDPVTGDLLCVGFTTSNNLNNFDNVSMEDGILGGNRDGIYVKFNPIGELIFHTYVGGEGQDNLTSVAVDLDPNSNTKLIYYVGHTNSGDGWPALVTQENSYQQNYSGEVDGFIIKRSGLSENIVWSTFFGSSENDWISDVELAKGSPVIIGITHQLVYSSSMCSPPNDGGFPGCNGPEGSNWYESSFENDGNTYSNYFAAWFGDDGTDPNEYHDELLWSTYVAPSFYDVDYATHGSVLVRNFGGFSEEDAFDIYFCGQVLVPNSPEDFTFPFLQEGWHQSIPSGHSDGFLLKFHSNGGTSILQKRGTVFGGNNGEIISGMAMDADRNIYITGQTFADNLQPEENWCIPPVNGDFPMCNLNNQLYIEENLVDNNNRAFVAAFLQGNNNGNFGQMLWSTLYGGGNITIGRAMCANDNKVWLVGHGSDSWTMVEYNTDPFSTDYFWQSGIDEQTHKDATVARFDISTITKMDEELRTKNEALVYPSPSSGIIFLSSPSLSSGEIVEIKVYDTLGNLIQNDYRPYYTGVSMNLSRLPAGQYFLKIVSKIEISVVKFQLF